VATVQSVEITWAYLALLVAQLVTVLLAMLMADLHVLTLQLV
jgi:hypothetical protein